MPKMYQKLLAGLGEQGDLELLEDVSENIRGRSFCVLADACIMPVQASIKHFRAEYEYMIEHGKSMYEKRSWWAA
jgi:NADH-quinone oxidoreductase subunit F